MINRLFPPVRSVWFTADVLVALAALAALVTAALGTLAGLGGAVLLVPILTLGGMEPEQAIPMGLLMVAAGSLAAAASQIESGYVNHRLGITVELAASFGALLGALLVGALPNPTLRLVVGTTALVAACANALPPDSTSREPASPADLTPGELPASLAGAYPHGSTVTQYEPVRTRTGTASMLVSGFVAGISGTSGGFLKTPILNRVMRVPVKVSAATTTFTVGITATTALVILLPNGGIDLVLGSVVVASALVGGHVGSTLQDTVRPVVIRSVLSSVLVLIGLVLLLGR